MLRLKKQYETQVRGALFNKPVLVDAPYARVIRDNSGSHVRSTCRQLHQKRYVLYKSQSQPGIADRSKH